MNIYTPTYLYVKQHSVTGLKYFGKTTQYPIKYVGSGKYWLSHIKKHGKEHVVTLWHQLFGDKDLLTDFALLFSEHWDIVKSDEWANLITENGLDGFPTGTPRTQETKDKISKTLTGRSLGEEQKCRMSLSSVGKKKTPEHSANISAGKKGRNIPPLSIEHRNKISIANKGKQKPTRTSEHSNKISIANKGKKRTIGMCLYCGRTMAISTIKRYHLDKCKLKPINDEENDDG